MNKFRKWNDLNQFHEVVKNLNYPAIHDILTENNYEIPFGLKIKLHGTNACVRIESDGKVVAQKRSSDLVAPADNNGFRKWVENHEELFSKLARKDCITYVFGEWCGPGVQKNVACSLTPLKTFWIYSIDYSFDNEENNYRLYEPDTIGEVINLIDMPDSVVIIPWHSSIKINFLEAAKTRESLDSLNELTEAIGAQDPLIKELFDISGCGEGVVAYPLLGQKKGQYLANENYFSYFNFKAKSEAHRVNATKTAVAYDPEKFASVQIFTDTYVTEPRLLQAFNEGVQGKRDMRLTGDFIRWMIADIYKESTTERESNPNVDWDKAKKAISSRSVVWYKKKVMEVVDA